jgi:hypothetical protein
MRTVAVELATREIKSRMDCAASLAPLNDVMRGGLDMKKRLIYFINFFNTLVYLHEFKHKSANSTTNSISAK